MEIYTEFLNFSIKSGDSWIWKGILRGRDLLKNGLTNIIGSGSSTKIWSELWAGSKDRRLIPPVSSCMTNAEFENFRVCHLLGPITKQWDVGQVRRYIVLANGLMFLLHQYLISTQRIR